MTHLNITIISANCFPYLGPRSHRTTELAKEFARLGHDVTVYAMLGDYDYTKYSRETGVIFKNLGKSNFGLTNNTNYRNKNLIYRAFTKFFGKLFAFPQIELTYLVKKAIRSNIEYTNLLITIAHPHAIHWAIPLIKTKKYNAWIADCGDPFMGDPFNRYPFYFKYIEKKWCRKVDYITIPIAEGKSGYYPEFRDKIRVIPQGFNFKEIRLAEYRENKIPTFAYSGIIYEGKRDPKKLMEYLQTLEYDFKFIVYTKSKLYFEQYSPLLKDKLEIRDYIPRNELLYELSKMDFLVNIKNESNVQQPSKLIDYYLTKRPIVEVSTGFHEKEIFNSFMKRDYTSKKNTLNMEKYNVENIARLFLNLINKYL